MLVLHSQVRPVVVFRGGESETFNMDEGFFVILALLEPPLVTLGTLALATVGRPGRPAPPGGQVGVQRRAGPGRGRAWGWR